MHVPSSRVRDLIGIGVDTVGNLADLDAGEDVLRLENLDTDLKPADVALQQTREALEDDANNSYLPFVGQLQLRNAVAEHVSRLSGVRYDGERNVIITAGGLSGILNVLLAHVSPGDEVVLISPTYVGLINRVVIAGGVPTFATFTTDDAEWILDRDSLRSAVTSRTRALLLMSPSMPTGAYLTRDDWEFVGEIAAQHDLWLIYDAAMERIVYDARPVVHPASIPNLADRTITVGSASKELRMIGWRVGWIVAPESLVPDLSLISMATVVVPVGIAQMAAAAALALDDDVRNATLEWERRRNTLLHELHGFPAVRPAGGWSLLLDASPFGVSGAELAERLFLEARIAVTPMNGWGLPDSARYVRFVFSNEPTERLRSIRSRITSLSS